MILIQSKQFKLNDFCSVFQAEMFAILEALKWLKEYLINNHNQQIKIILFSDSMSSLFSISQFDSSNQIVTQIKNIYLDIINSGYYIKFCWCKSHSGIYGIQFDTLAKEATNLSINDSIRKYFPLSHAKIVLKNYFINKWNDLWLNSTNGSVTKRYFPTVYHKVINCNNCFRPNFKLTQILSGHGDYKDYLFRFKFIDNNLCECEKTAETLFHKLFDCDKNLIMYNLKTTVNSLGFNWPPNETNFIHNRKLFYEFLLYINKI